MKCHHNKDIWYLNSDGTKQYICSKCRQLVEELPPFKINEQ